MDIENMFLNLNTLNPKKVNTITIVMICIKIERVSLSRHKRNKILG